MGSTNHEADTALKMAERLQQEGLIGMGPAARLFGQYRNSPTHPATVGRWITRGAKMPDGSLVRLEAVRISGRLATSKAACLRFIAVQTAAMGSLTADAAEERASAKPPAGQRNRRRAAERAATELQRMGC